MNIASLPLHRLNTRTLRSVQLTVLSLSFSNARKRNGPIILPLVFRFSLSTSREEEEEEAEQVKEKEEKRLLLMVIRKRTICALAPSFLILLHIHYHIDARFISRNTSSVR